MQLTFIRIILKWLILFVDAPIDSCCIKRKSTTLSETTEEAATDGASPEKKTKLDEKSAETESNGEAEATA